MGERSKKDIIQQNFMNYMSERIKSSNIEKKSQLKRYIETFLIHVIDPELYKRVLGLFNSNNRQLP